MLRPQVFDPGDFVEVFAQMGVQPGVGKLFAQLLHRRQQRGRGGWREARRNGIAQAATLVPALYQLAGLPIALFRAFAEILRRVAIHHHLSGQQTHIQTQRFAKQRIHRLRMQGTKYQRGSGAVAEQLAHKKARDLCGIVGIGKLAFDGKSIGGQPLKQLFAESPDHFRLRIVDVGIDKARQQQLTAQVAIAR